MSVEIVMTRESFDCLEKLIPKEVVRGHAGPGVPAGLRYETSPGRAHLQSRARGKAARDRPTPMWSGS
jgi:hypothetical protein